MCITLPTPSCRQWCHWRQFCCAYRQFFSLTCTCTYWFLSTSYRAFRSSWLQTCVTKWLIISHTLPTRICDPIWQRDRVAQKREIEFRLFLNKSSLPISVVLKLLGSVLPLQSYGSINDTHSENTNSKKSWLNVLVNKNQWFHTCQLLLLILLFIKVSSIQQKLEEKKHWCSSYYAVAFFRRLWRRLQYSSRNISALKKATAQ